MCLGFAAPPTLASGSCVVETRLLDFGGDLNEKSCSTDLLERLRPDERFDSLEELVAQMAFDKARAREVLTRQGTGRAGELGEHGA